MSTLAQIKGVEGAIIDGLTRDSAQTRAIQFPIFSRDNYARDIKKRGIIASKDETVYIDKVRVDKGYLIIGDSDGVIIVPKNIEEEIIARAIKSAKLEYRIKIAIKTGVPVKTIIEQNGEF
jgi:regulator of RNase E activity RraA